MKTLSMDLRERIVAAYEANEGSHRVLAARFSVSHAVVGKLVRQARRLGTLDPQVHLRGRKRVISGEKERELRKHLDQHPDATLEKRIRALGLDCCVNTMWQSVKRLGHSFKKSPREPQNKIARMSPNCD
jgi:transposase